MAADFIRVVLRNNANRPPRANSVRGQRSTGACPSAETAPRLAAAAPMRHPPARATPHRRGPVSVILIARKAHPETLDPSWICLDHLDHHSAGMFHDLATHGHAAQQHEDKAAKGVYLFLVHVFGIRQGCADL